MAKKGIITLTPGVNFMKPFSAEVNGKKHKFQFVFMTSHEFKIPEKRMIKVMCIGFGWKSVKKLGFKFGRKLLGRNGALKSILGRPGVAFKILFLLQL
jgi:hypothetical protein